MPCDNTNNSEVGYPWLATEIFEKEKSRRMSRACPPFLQFLAMVRRNLSEEEIDLSASPTSSGVHSSEIDNMANKVGEVFKQMDVRGDGEVSWEDFSAVRIQ